jgi:hypothetical protein
VPGDLFLGVPRGAGALVEAAIARSNAVTTVEVLEELIRLAEEIRGARARGEESGLSDDLLTRRIDGIVLETLKLQQQVLRHNEFR